MDVHVIMTTTRRRCETRKRPLAKDYSTIATTATVVVVAEGMITHTTTRGMTPHGDGFVFDAVDVLQLPPPTGEIALDLLRWLK